MLGFWGGGFGVWLQSLYWKVSFAKWAGVVFEGVAGRAGCDARKGGEVFSGAFSSIAREDS